MQLHALVIGASALSLVAGAAFAQASANVNVPARVLINPQLSASAGGTQLDFGTITRATGGAGTVRVTTAGARSLVSASGLATAGGSPAAAAVTVAGPANQNITVSATDVVLATGMTVHPVFGGGANSGGATSGAATLDGDGVLALPLGGDLVIDTGASNPTGQQSANMTVTVAYP